MTIEEIIRQVESLGGVLTLRPSPGDGSPELAWGDLFFYYAPDGALPQGQPFATIITKDYPDEPSSGLGNGTFRLNIDARGSDRRTGPVGAPTDQDTVIPHPTYAELGWVSVVRPGERTADAIGHLLAEAHEHARRRWTRRHAQ
ncbi:DUF6194 family protein [Nocardioides sp. GCM10030258]|uniref:DUF6194 family protein n=1 Tax=unclassified Nocardioides TaxID=2615069 RepID=UPI003622CE71